MRRATSAPVLLMTRPETASRRFLDLLPAELLQHLRVIEAPLMQITPLSGPLKLSRVATVIFTSGEGVRVASDKTTVRLPARCVGERTTAAANAAGWQASCAGETAEDLVACLIAEPPQGSLLHLHGEHTRGDVVGRLVKAGLPCTGQMIYRQVLLPLTDEAKQVLRAQAPLLVPLFSPRTAAHFASLCPNAAHLTLIAMSEAVVEALPRLHCEALHVSKAPTASAMAEMLRDVAWPLVRVEDE